MTRRFAAATAAAALTCASVSAADWHQFRGPTRDGKSADTGLMKAWPNGGPKCIWTAKGIGYGFSTVTIRDGLVYTTGVVGEDLKLTALAMDGTTKWRVTHGRGWSRDRPGSRAIPTIDGDHLYLMSGHGLLRQYDRKTGEPGWQVNLPRTFSARVPMWGYSESVLIDGKNLICTPGGRDACLVALNKATGEAVWRSKGLSDTASHASPILFETGGVRQIANITKKGLVCVEAGTGRYLWRYNRVVPARRPSCSDALYADGMVFGASGYRTGGGAVRLTVVGRQVTAAQVWETTDMVNHHGGMILLDGALYGYSDGDGWTCLDFRTGKVNWKAPGVGKGSVTYADGLLYCYAEKDGTTALVKASPETYEEVSRFKVPSGGKGPYWAYPVVCGGRLYVRHAERLYAYNVKAE